MGETFKPLTFTASLNDIICKYENEKLANIEFYRFKMYELGVAVLLKQLASCYKSISWKRFKQLTFSDDQLTDIQLERIIAFSVYYGNVCCRISHSNRLLTFNDNNVESTMFCESIVELNAMLVRIKDEHTSIDTNHHSVQRQNVFNQIRNQISLEHDKITTRLSRIRRTRTNQIIIKRHEEKKKDEEIKKKKQAQKVKEQKEKEKVKESQKTIIEKQKNTEENEKKKTDAKQKWAEMLVKSSMQQTTTKQIKNASKV